MTNINLNDKVKKPLVAGLAALSLGASGCATMSEAERQEWRDWATVTGSVLRLSGILTGDVQDAAVGDTLLRGAEVASMSEIARKGGTQVHVYPERERSRVYRGCEEFSGYRGIDNWVVNRYGDCVPAENNQVTRGRLSPEGQRNKERVAREMERETGSYDKEVIYVQGKGLIEMDKGLGFNLINKYDNGRGVFALAANYGKDFNEDGGVSPSELVGIKDTFREDEKFGLGLYELRRVSGNRSLEIFSPQGEMIYESTGVVTGCPQNSEIGLHGEYFYSESHVHKDEEGNYITKHTCDQIENTHPLLPFFVERGGYGNYKAIWKNNGEYTTSYEFEIVPSIENRN